MAADASDAPDTPLRRDLAGSRRLRAAPRGDVARRDSGRNEGVAVGVRGEASVLMWNPPCPLHIRLV